MEATLPPIATGKRLGYRHFPTTQQLFIYRNWDMVSPQTMARVLKTDAQTVSAMAADMGLPEPTGDDETWREKGYITIIRANWHLLTYAQICELLGWRRERLAYVLREDDFLSVKLGGFKPDVPPLLYRPLTEKEQAQTAQIRRLTRRYLAQMPPQQAKPFDFEPYFSLFSGREPTVRERTSADRRIVYSYCALYGDVFSDEALMEASFPESLLESYRRIGINGIWVQAVLYTLVPFPFDADVSRGHERRLAGLKSLVDRCGRFGLSVYLYLNEPRAMPDSFFIEHPQLQGTSVDGYSSLCTALPEVKAYLRDSAAYLVRNVPDLGGFFTITASENLTNCVSQTVCTCPRCAARRPAEIFAEVDRLLVEGATSVRPDFPLLAYTWGWGVRQVAEETIRALPPSVTVMTVSEEGVQKTVGGTKTEVLDYSLSVEGPGDYALGTWRTAKETGHRTCAKLQLNNSWEMAAVPYIPVFDTVYRHVARLLESGTVDDLLLSWTLGGAPSPTLQMVDILWEGYRKTGELLPLHSIYGQLFPGEDVRQIGRAVSLFSQAFDAYPFHLYVAYFGPQNVGPADLLWRRPTGWQATMVCYPYDDLDRWRRVFPRDTFIRQWRLLTERWAEGLAVLHPLLASGSPSPLLQQLWDNAEACYCHFRSALLQAMYICRRESEDCTAILREETDLALRLAQVVSRDATIGYESSNHYFYTRYMLFEKCLNCRYLEEGGE